MTSLGRTERRRYDVATTSCCLVGSNGKDLSLLSTLYKDIGSDWNLLVSDTDVLMEVESTTLLHCMVFIGK